MAAVPGLPLCALETGPLETLEPMDGVLAWGETEAVRAERVRSARPAAEGRSAEPGGGVSIADALRAGARGSPEAASRANHKCLVLGALRELGAALPGAAVIRTVRELDGHLAAGGARASPAGRWVLKAPHSAGGRLRVRGTGDVLLRPQREGAARLLDLQGEALFEPWMERDEDLGAVAEARPGGVRILGRHRSLNTGGGVFRGIRVPPLAGDPGSLGVPDDAIRAAGRRVLLAGYKGMFGVDAWTYRDAAGDIALHPVGEINARFTFGAVAAALVERLRGAGAFPEDAPVIVRVGAAAPPPGSGAIPLLLPGDPDATQAWAESG